MSRYAHNGVSSLIYVLRGIRRTLIVETKFDTAG